MRKLEIDDDQLTVYQASRPTRTVAHVSEPRSWDGKPNHNSSEDEVVLLKELWSGGTSASQIAGQIKGVTRNAVIGKIHRLGLSGRATVGRLKSHRNAKLLQPRQPRPKIKTIPRLSALTGLYKSIAANSGNLPLPPASASDIARVALVDLEPHHCRWPSGDPVQGFCGCDKVPGLSYCETHARRAYAVSAPRVAFTNALNPVVDPEFDQRAEAVA